MKPLVSALNLVPIREGQTHAQAFESMVTLAKTVESLGYHRYWIAEHHNMPSLLSSATQVLVGHVLAHTHRIRVGAGGVMLPNHSPLMVAEQYGTLATLYPDRVDVGLGRAPGTDYMTAAALRRRKSDVAERFPEDVQQLQRYFGPADKQGQVRALPGMDLAVPLYILGSSPDSAHLAAEMGLPYAFASHFAPRFLDQALDTYRREFKPSAELSEPRVTVALNVIAADTHEEARHLATSQDQFFLNIVRNTRRPLQPPVDSMEGLWTESEEAMASQMLACSLIGSPDDIAHQFADLHERLRADEYLVVSYIHDEQKQHAAYRIFKEVSAAS
ncbi:MAG: LLM class flavin-dependent oxidoreductase [Lautropia sp.]|nr:LLM class flavin-dependent oxidoreductase [Lautropia sp.]